ncbi:MAG: LTA synthase family protein [Gemmatimonadaceae bacterium]|nr:LTA synthase family protein [Gemmatimonadaceae bacterium]
MTASPSLDHDTHAHGVARPRGEPLEKIRFLARYIAFWFVFFTLLRLAFLAYHAQETATLGAGVLAGLLARGARMDISAASYLALLPLLLLAFAPIIPARALALVLRTYSVLAIFVAALLTAVDVELFAKWGSRIDTTLLPYLRTPREAAASAESSPIALLALLLIALTVLGLWGYRRLVEAHIAEATDGRLLRTAPPLLLCGLLLVVPIRGGLQWTPLNPSSTYFSHSDFANQAGLNAAWNFLHSLTIKDYRTTNPYASAIAEPEARQLVDSLLHTTDGSTLRLLRVERPNVILIIWESATAKVVQRLGGLPGITPHFDSLTHSGILFDAIYASGNRSSKGLAAILSGWPAQASAPILSSPARAARLPGLATDMAHAGYHTSFYYGGELEFADFKSYLVAHGFDRIVGEDDFDRKDWSSKWGAHDQFVLERLLSDARAFPRPFFSTLFTLSSHEPYDVPMAHVIPGTSEESRFLNSHVYADRSIGAFVAAAARESWWDSTLVIIIADHGHPLPRLTPRAGEDASQLYHIPMLWLGGALAVRDTVVTVVGSQVDVAPTLLAQLDLAHAHFKWGKNLLAADVRPFAFFSYLDGFGWVDPHGRLVYSDNTRQVMQRTPGADDRAVRAGEAYQRLTYQDFLQR